MLFIRSLKPAILAIAVLAAACDRQSAAPAQPAQESTALEGTVLNGTIDRSHEGAPIPDFTFSDPAGQTLQLRDLDGLPVLVNLWATWCAPCIKEMPMLDELAMREKGKLHVITISQDMQGAAKVEPFFAQAKYRQIEPWLDPDNNFGFHLGGATLPTTILYDAQGREIWRMAGAYDWAGDKAATLISEALGHEGQ